MNDIEYFLLCCFVLVCSITGPSNAGDVDLQGSDWDVKTITSALKFYLRYVCM